MHRGAFFSPLRRGGFFADGGGRERKRADYLARAVARMGDAESNSHFNS